MSKSTMQFSRLSLLLSTSEIRSLYIYIAYYYSISTTVAWGAKSWFIIFIQFQLSFGLDPGEQTNKEHVGLGGTLKTNLIWKWQCQKYPTNLTHSYDIKLRPRNPWFMIISLLLLGWILDTESWMVTQVVSWMLTLAIAEWLVLGLVSKWNVRWPPSKNSTTHIWIHLKSFELHLILQ